MSFWRYSAALLLASILLTALMPISYSPFAWAVTAIAFILPSLLAAAFVARKKPRDMLAYKWPTIIFLTLIGMSWLGQI